MLATSKKLKKKNGLQLHAGDLIFIFGHFKGTGDFDPGPGIFNLTGVGMFISKLDRLGNFDPSKPKQYTIGYFMT